MTDHYYVIGCPVKHSLSPKIHRQFALQYGQNMCYRAMEVKSNNLNYILNLLKNDPSVRGLSITSPFKERLYKHCDQLDDLSKEAKAVSNVIIDHNRKFLGINLDGLGLINDIKKNLSISFRHKNILILGAGGAARGLLYSVLREKPTNITIANRTEEKAKALVKNMKSNHIQACTLKEINGAFDIVINATSSSINNESLSLYSKYFSKNALAYDLGYSPNGTIFTNWCRTNKIQAVEGTGMLMELSKLAFYHWRGILPS